MYKFLLFLGLLCLTHAEAKNFKLDVGGGYRQDSFQWELAGPSDKLPVLSRLSWDDLHIFELTAQLKKITCQNIYFRTYANYGWIFDGKNRDSDFEIEKSSSNVVEWSRSDNNGGDGFVWDFSAALGYFFRLECIPGFRIAPLVGYSVHGQNLRMFDGFQTIDLMRPDFANHHFRHLHNKYDACWKGAWLGSDFYYHCTDCITLNSSLEFHWLNYRAKGHWNLRDDFADDFTHTGDGYGIFGSVGLDYNFTNGWYLGCQYNCSYAELRNGKDRTPVRSIIETGVLPNQCKEADDLQDIIVPMYEEVVNTAKGALRSVKWHSFSFLVTAGYHF